MHENAIRGRLGTISKNNSRGMTLEISCWCSSSLGLCYPWSLYIFKDNIKNSFNRSQLCYNDVKAWEKSKKPAIGHKGPDRKGSHNFPVPSLRARNSRPHAPEFSSSTHSTRYSLTDCLSWISPYSVTRKTPSWQISIFSSLVCLTMD